MHKAYSFLYTYILLAAGTLVLTNCAREYSYEGGNTKGSYTLVGSPGTCSGAVIMGSYTAGAVLTSDDTIQLLADVTKAGSYNISTNSDNGIYFSGSGNFADTGLQKITLKGNGKPIIDGSFSFTATGMSGCSFTITINKATTVTAGFTLTGAPNTCSSPVVNGSYVAGVQLTSANTVTVQVNVTTPGPYTLKTDTLDGISFSKSGVFTTTGNQNVVLVGSGKPVTPANLSFALTGAASDCILQLPVVNPEPLAVYVLESGLNICTHTVSGTYVSNTPLTSSNTVTIRVYVVLVGNFTISTTTLNGMTFSYTGTFTTIGAQDVTLNGIGTPVSAGVYTFTPQIVGPHPLGGQACDFDITVL